MKKLGLFLFNFLAFFGIVVLMGVGAVAFLYLALCFVSWEMLGVANLATNTLVALRCVAVIAFMITTSWIFTEGRREWDYR